MWLDDTAGMNSRARKLDADDVHRIRELYDAGCGPSEIKRRLGLDVERWTIAKIGKRQAWASIPERGTVNA